MAKHLTEDYATGAAAADDGADNGAEEQQTATTTEAQTSGPMRVEIGSPGAASEISDTLPVVSPGDVASGSAEGRPTVQGMQRVLQRPASREGSQGPRDRANLEAMTKTIENLQEMMRQMQADVNRLQEENVALRNIGIMGTGNLKPLQDIDKKDVEKPGKFKGDPLQWRGWLLKFTAFLARRDQRWSTLIKEIKERSQKPMEDDDEAEVFKAMDIRLQEKGAKELAAKFKEQFHEYLDNFTDGTVKSMVQAAGADGVMEVFRVMCDENHSKRDRHLKKEYRTVTNPKQASFENLRQAIATWETEVAEYEVASGRSVDDRTRLLCLEDMCPDSLQQHIASKEHLETYAGYKSVINDFLVERKRWTTPNARGKINWLGLQEAQEETNDENFDDNGDNTEGDVDNIMDEVKTTLLALVRSKFQNGPGGGKAGKGKLGKGGKFGKGGKGGGKPDGKAMDVDEPRCFECNEPMAKCGHSARDCPVRKARVAAGGPERLPKGAGKGTGKSGKGGWPSRQMWSNFYPGPTQAQWRGWYPQNPHQPAPGPPAGKLNLFEQPHQLSSASPLQSLLTTLGTCYSIKPRDKVKDENPKSFAHKNKFAALEREESPGCEKSLTVNLMDAVKKPSRNRQRKTAVQETAPMQTNSTTKRPRPRTSELPINKSAMNDNGTILEAMLKFVNDPMKGDSPTAAPAKVVSADSVASLPAEGRPAYRRTTGHDADGGDGTTGTGSRPQEYSRIPGTNSIHSQILPCRKIYPTGVQNFQTAVSGTPPMVDFVNENGKVTTNKEYAKDKNDVPNPESKMTPTERYVTPERAAYLKTLRGDDTSFEDNAGKAHATADGPCYVAEVKGPSSTLVAGMPVGQVTCVPDGALNCALSTKKLGDRGDDAERDVLKVLNPTVRNQSLKQVTQRKTVPSLGGEFEVLSSVVDSGATVPVMHPEDAADYELLESQASRDGVEYEVANLETIPNLGEKKFAILTAEGTLRGYQTQCAETAKGKPLQAVRALVASRHAVCFGLGENDNEHLIINKIYGKVNRMRDDGINYLQDMLVVPQNRIEQVQQHLWSIQQRANDQDQDFTWQG